MSARRFGSLLLVVLACALPAARAMPTAASIAAALREIDTTRNQAISPAEWQAASFALFRATDKNDNHFIDADELKASALAQDTFRRLDADHDGRLSIDEFMKLRREIFVIADYNHDDYVTLVEFELLALYEAVGWRERDEVHRLPVAQLPLVLAKAFALLDENKDGQLDPTEAAYMQPERYLRFDRDQDGKLSAEELSTGYRKEFEA